MQIFLPKKNFRWLVVVMLALFLSVSGCADSDTDTDDTANAPVLPPAYTLVPNFSTLGGGSGTSASEDGTLVENGIRKLPDNADNFESTQAGCVIDNYLHAASNVFYWNTVLFFSLAVPVWSFNVALLQDPVQQEDGSWVWSYSGNNNGDMYTAELHGEFVDDQVHWEMIISKQEGFQDFVWYTGTSNLPATEGTWTLKKSPLENHDWIDIVWNRTISNRTWEVTYTNILEGDNYKDSFIAYGVNSDDTYDAFYDIYTSENENLVNIDVNRSTRAGRIKDVNKFGDEDWQYWNESLCNIDAPGM